MGEDRLLTTAELSEYLSVPIATIYIWRHRKSAPPAIRVGRGLRWRLSAVDGWLAERAEQGSA